MTTQIEYSKPRGTYYTVLADGKFHTEVEEGSEGAVKREYETSDGKKGVKHERIAQRITGIISNVAIYDGDYGKSLQLSFGDNDLIVSLATQSSYGEDMMKKLPNIDMDKEVELSPYSFVDENGKTRKGISIKQGDVKIQSFYTEKKGEKFITVNGYPEVPKESKDWDKEDWKIYFAQARKFLVGEVEKNKKFNAVAPDALKATVGGSVEYPKEEGVSPEEISF